MPANFPRWSQRFSVFLALAALGTFAALGTLAVAADTPSTRCELNVAVPMRDGTVLRADVVQPTADGPYPVLVMRTPYGKNNKFEKLAAAGYIVVVQDVRGRYASDGLFESFMRTHTHDEEDGYDTVEWAAKMPNSTGKVGTFGISYNAFYQWRLASVRPPSLVAMAACSIPAKYTDLEGPGTFRPGRRLRWWQSAISPDMRRRVDGPKPHNVEEAKKAWDDDEEASLFGTYAALELPDSIYAHEAEYVRTWLRDPRQDPWKLDLDAAETDVPNLNITGWFDHCNNTIDMHHAIVQHGHSAAARDGSRLIIGPWNHVGLGKQKCGEIDFGPAAKVDMDLLQARWFDHWIKGAANGVDKDPRVWIYVMGQNRWRAETAWPLERAERKSWFLTSAGHANTPSGDGRLVVEPADDVTDHYQYDPRDPVPTQWSKEMFTISADQRPLAKRQDMLVYQTEPLKEAVEVTGHAVLELHVASSAPDTDFFGRLIDVAPNGVARDLSQGMVRLRFREGLDQPKLVTPGEVVRLVIRFGPTSNEFQPGHRIRVDVTSSDYPNYERNHNTAADQNADATLAVAEQTVHHGKKYPARLILPIIAHDARAEANPARGPLP